MIRHSGIYNRSALQFPECLHTAVTASTGDKVSLVTILHQLISWCPHQQQMMQSFYALRLLDCNQEEDNFFGFVMEFGTGSDSGCEVVGSKVELTFHVNLALFRNSIIRWWTFVVSETKWIGDSAKHECISIDNIKNKVVFQKTSTQLKHMRNHFFEL